MKVADARASKRERLHQILGLYGAELITREEFETMMKDQKLTDDDIDRYCRGELR